MLQNKSNEKLLTAMKNEIMLQAVLNIRLQQNSIKHKEYKCTQCTMR